MKTSRLNEQRIIELHRAAISLGLDRNALLAGAAKEFVAGLSTHSTPAEQILADLHALNQVVRLTDGSDPLRTWLMNAFALSRSRSESRVFRQHQSRISGDADNSEGHTKDPSLGAQPSSSDVYPFIAANLETIPRDHESAMFKLWHVVQLARIGAGLSVSQQREMRRTLAAGSTLVKDLKRWSNGKEACIGRTWYYPNGKEACIGRTWYYPNGKEACIGESWYYPNEESANIGRHWYHPDGRGDGLEGEVLMQACHGLDDRTHDLVLAGINRLEGQIRRLAVLEVLWYASRNMNDDDY